MSQTTSTLNTIPTASWRGLVSNMDRKKMRGFGPIRTPAIKLVMALVVPVYQRWVRDGKECWSVDFEQRNIDIVFEPRASALLFFGRIVDEPA